MPSNMPEHRRILIIKPSSLGDIVHALPTLSKFRDRWPNAQIGWVVKRQWAELLERVKGLDRIWRLDPGLGGWVSLVRRLRAEQFDLVIDLQGLFRSALMTRLTGCATRVGLANGREGSPWFYTIRVPVPTPNMHAVDRYLLVAAALGAKQGPPEFRLRGSVGDRRRVSEVLAEQGLKAEQSWIAMNVSARWTTKRWPAQYFAAVADRLQADGLGPVAIIGAPDDRPAARAVIAQAQRSIIDLTGTMSVGLLPALLSSTSVLLTNDSGPLHVAVAMGTPVVALFGPTDPTRTGPYGLSHGSLTSGVPCRPCFNRVCRNPTQLECLYAITPERVADMIREHAIAPASRIRPETLSQVER
jgi:lipopolysaccharide heptosyltransferase I